MIDTHCHLNDEQYKGIVDDIVNNFLSNGIEKVVCVGCDKLSNEKAKDIASTYPSVFYAVGYHPEDCENFDESLLKGMLNMHDKKLVAVGEIGLDYHYNVGNKQRQIEVFIKQIMLAREFNLPIIIHCRDAYGDCLEILKRFAPFSNGAVMHCYSGSLEFAKELEKLGVKISFTGSVTFSNAKKVQEVAQSLPLDMIMVETDSPYMSPTPLRGTRNEPKNVVLVAKFIANLKGMSMNELDKITTKTAKNFFRF